MFNEEFMSYPGRAEMLELLQQRESSGASLDQRGTGEARWPICIFQSGDES